MQQKAIWQHELNIWGSEPDSIFFFAGKLLINLSSIMAVQKTQEAMEIICIVGDHLATTTRIGASRSRAANITPP